VSQSIDIAVPKRHEPIIGAVASSKAPSELTSGQHVTSAVTMALTAVLGLIGFVNSFSKIHDAALPYFGGLAITVPIGIDVAILVFSLLDIVLAIQNMRVPFLRFIPWALTIVTVYLNVSGETALFSIVAHATLPLLWVIAVEVGTHVMRKRSGLAAAEHMDKVRLSRWILSPISTFSLWRRMVLWEIRSYPMALSRERDRVLARTDLQDRYGRLWRFKATRREKAMYRLGELVPSDFVPFTQESVPEDESQDEAQDGVQDEKPTGEDDGSKGKRTKRRTKQDDAPKLKKLPDATDLLPAGREVVEELKKSGRSLTRDGLILAMRDRGIQVSTDRATDLMRKLKDEESAGQTANSKPELKDEQLDIVKMAGVA
jgi:hypothetical protein